MSYPYDTVGASGSDGSFGPATQAAVKAFNRQTAQRGSKRAASGIVDSVTWNTLTNAVLTKSSSGYFPVAICNSKRMGSLSAGEKTSLQTALGRMDSNAGANIFQELADRYAKGNATVGQLKGGLFQKVLVTNTMPVESNYLERSLRQFAYGNYTDDVTLLGTIAEVAAGILDVDLLMDIRDIAYDLTHSKEVGLGQKLIDGVALLPVIGALKYSDEAGALLKHSDELADAAKGYSSLDEGINFSRKALEHMKESGRRVPLQTLQDAIRYGEAMPDPRGSSAIMYYTTVHINGKMYNLEVLYDKATNTVFHFKYARNAMGNLPAIPK